MPTRILRGSYPRGITGREPLLSGDQGWYEPIGIDTDDRKEQDKNVRFQLHKGELKIRMHGEKLQGAFVIAKVKDKDEKSWFLIKIKDEFASQTDITQQDRSVVSGLTLEETAATSTNEWESNRKTKQTSKAATGPASATIGQLVKKGKKSPIPSGIKPMLATLDKDPFDNPQWVFEIKWDGYRAIATVEQGSVLLESRNNLSLAKFKPVFEELKKLKMNAVLDGEIAVLNDEDKPDFQLLQSWQKEGKGKMVYMVFDVLWYQGYDLTRLALTERKKILEQVLPSGSVIRYCDHVPEKGKEFYNVAVEWGLEGIIAKKADSLYIPGERSRNWLKLKNNHFMEAVVAGFTEGRNSRKHFGALVLGTFKNGELVYIGHTGSGMDDKTVAEVYKQLEKLVTKECPFKVKPATNMPATWVKPELVCEVKYQEMTQEGILRIPIFQGMRADKKAPDLKREAAHLEKVVQAAKKATKATKPTASDKAAKKTGLLIPEGKKEMSVLINRKELILTNLDKLYWPEDGITKREMLNYYYEVMPYMLPYMKDRPQSLNRHPNGIHGKSFFQKDVKGKVAKWIETYHYVSESSDDKDFLVCKDEASLMYIATLGCIEMNPWHSRIQSPDKPDWCVIDLDPNGVAFEKIIETAHVVKQVLDAVGVPSYAKTSGSSGLHIYVPFGAKYSYNQSKLFAELVVSMVHHELPKTTSIERSPSKRKGLIYLDFLQNRSIQTIAAPYSVRPKPGATVSTPLHWEEVKKGLAISDFTIHNIMDRLRHEGDLFTGVLGEGIDLEKVLAKLADA
jgi:bifunctional non-homologous end joining protein LigD